MYIHIDRQGSVEYFFGFEVRKFVFLLGTGHSCCIFWGCQISAVFLSVLCFQQYLLGPVLFT